MSKPSGLNVFESDDEIQIKIEKSSPILSAAGFYCLLPNYSLFLTSGVEEDVRPGFEAPLAYIQCGGDRQLWFKTQEAADKLIRRIDDARNQHELEQQPPLRSPYKETFLDKIQSFIGTCVTGIFVCFLGAGAANIGWKTFDPLATSLAGTHRSDDQEQARLAEEAYHRIITTDSLASIKKMLDVERLQQQKSDEFQRSFNLAQMQADEQIKNNIEENYQKLFAQEARELADKKFKLKMQRPQLLPEQETQAQ